MRGVDPCSLILAFLMVQLAVFWALVADLYRDRDTMDSAFLIGRSLQILGWGMIFYRDVLPNWASVSLGNGIMFAGICLDAATLVRLSMKPPRWFKWTVLSLWGIFTGALLTEPLGLMRMSQVMTLDTVIHGALLGISAFMFLAAPNVSPLRLVLSASYATVSLVLLWRAFWLLGIDSYRLGDPSIPQVASILGAFGISTLSAISYGLLKKEWAIRQIRVLADQDSLTHLHNRRAFIRLGNEMMERAKSSRTPLWAMMIDIDHFKCINDTYGHSAGDEIISDVAFLMSKVLGGHVTCRYGGEEFAALVMGVDRQRALALAEALRIKAMESSIMGICYTVSIGLAELLDQKNVHGLVNDADSAMYAAKRLGRNRVEIYDPKTAMTLQNPLDQWECDDPTAPQSLREMSNIQ